MSCGKEGRDLRARRAECLSRAEPLSFQQSHHAAWSTPIGAPCRTETTTIHFAVQNLNRGPVLSNGGTMLDISKHSTRQLFLKGFCIAVLLNCAFFVLALSLSRGGTLTQNNRILHPFEFVLLSSMGRSICRRLSCKSQCASRLSFDRAA